MANINSEDIPFWAEAIIDDFQRTGGEFSDAPGTPAYKTPYERVMEAREKVSRRTPRTEYQEPWVFWDNPTLGDAYRRTIATSDPGPRRDEAIRILDDYEDFRRRYGRSDI